MLLEAIQDLNEETRIRTSGGLDLSLKNAKTVAAKKLIAVVDELRSDTPEAWKNAHYMLYGGGAAGEPSSMEDLLSQIIRVTEEPDTQPDEIEGK